MRKKEGRERQKKEWEREEGIHMAIFTPGKSGYDEDPRTSQMVQKETWQMAKMNELGAKLLYSLALMHIWTLQMSVSLMSGKPLPCPFQPHFPSTLPGLWTT
jgi:hypothetical protein